MKATKQVIIGSIFIALSALSLIVSLNMSMTEAENTEYVAYLAMLLLALGQRQFDINERIIQFRVIAELSLLREIRRIYMTRTEIKDEDLLAASIVATNDVAARNHPLYREHSRDAVEDYKEYFSRRSKP
jgi:hypothetical protein